MYVSDTIAAIATPPGRGAIGIIRISGPLCVSIASRVFQGIRGPAGWRPGQLYRGHALTVEGRPIDDVLAVRMAAPHSYTGEDILELHCHGSPLVLRHLLAHVFACGARPASPGEFTRRAFLNGRLDLAQAEAVIDLIDARTDTAAAVATDQLGGHLSAALAELRDKLFRFKAHIEAHLDFSEEDLPIDPKQLEHDASLIYADVKSLIDTYRKGALLRSGARVAIVGKPNAGKSSLLNALLGRDRAIVSDTAGTTRDTIEEIADFDGVPIVLTDTAGLRSENSADSVERIGMARTGEAVRQADLCLVVLDTSTPLSAEDHAVLDAVRELRHLIILNKSDLPCSPELMDFPQWQKSGAVRVSARQRTGLEDLRSAVVALLESESKVTPGGTLITNPRHHAALLRAAEALQLARESLRVGHPLDVVAVDVQEALDHVGSITGVVTTEDILDRIFAEFCIGK